MATTLEQQPNRTWQMGADHFLCTVSNDAVVSGVPTAYFNVKFLAEVFIDSEPINTGSSAQLVGTFKTIPNNLGRGIYDFRSVIENFVSPQNRGFPGTDTLPASRYKGMSYSSLPHPIHLIDEFALNEDLLRYIKIQFKIEGATVLGGPVQVISGTTVNSNQFLITNTYVPVTDAYEVSGQAGNLSSYGWVDTTRYYMRYPDAGTGHYLTNVPLTQFVNWNEYGTLSFLQNFGWGNTKFTRVEHFSEDGTLLGSDDIELTATNGAVYPETTSTDTQIVTVGAGPQNIATWNTQFSTDLWAGLISYYEITQRNSANTMTKSETYRYNVNCSPFKNYEPIRICWLNQLGCWDYYSFNKKSTRSLNTSKVEWTQQAGTWNGEFYQIWGYKGGRKTFRSNTKMSVKVNTGYVTEDWSILFEELINSPEIYVLRGYSIDPALSIANKYVHPLKLKTSSFTRKTKANDKLIQYSFDFEYSKYQNVQNA